MTGFTDLQFIFRFCPVILGLYYLVPAHWRRVVLILASLVFYGMGDLRFLPLLVLLMLLNYAFSGPVQAHRRWSLILIVTLDALTLIAFKALAALWGGCFLPIGLSFYSFRMIAFQADLYTGRVKGRGEGWTGFLQTCLYFCMFPQLVSGPIARYGDWEGMNVFSGEEEKLPEGERLLACLRRIEQGLYWFIPGLAMKVLLADHLAMCWNEIGTIGYESLSTPLAWLGVVVYSMDLLFDFWGYSLMAAGLGVALGFPFIRNFNYPYAATGVSDFYRRWHITLGTWFRDMVYIPLGGSRGGLFRTAVNLLVVWLLTALWHGVTLNFILWGMLLYLMILWEKMVWSNTPRLRAVIGRIHVWLCVPLTWIIFALSGTSDLIAYFRRLFFLDAGGNVSMTDFARVGVPYLGFVAVGLILLIPDLGLWYERHKNAVLMKLICLALFWASIYSAAGQSSNPFMYLRF
ncbi:MAG: MBOAT family protein [Butyrivibrio sp.]|nr:MBOAT family protein [Butyrivibrio sp.]